LSYLIGQILPSMVIAPRLTTSSFTVQICLINISSHGPKVGGKSLIAAHHTTMRRWLLLCLTNLVWRRTRRATKHVKIVVTTTHHTRGSGSR